MILPKITLEFPGWLEDSLQQIPHPFPTPEDRMQWVMKIARRNITEGTGGPFAAGIFRLDTYQLVAPGINVVQTTNCSIFHAEIMAILVAQHILQSHNLGEKRFPPYELVTSCEPCTMCLGAVIWSGLGHVVCGARGTDAEAIGFDEGPKPSDWITALETRGISVKIDIGRTQSIDVLHDYVRQGGKIYNGRQGTTIKSSQKELIEEG